MKIDFSIEYYAAEGERLAMRISDRTFEMTPCAGGTWTCSIVTARKSMLRYSYAVMRGAETVREEWGEGHTLRIGRDTSRCEVRDRWHDMPSDSAFYSSAFTDGIFARTAKAQPAATRHGAVLLEVEAAAVPPSMRLAVAGDCEALGRWSRPVAMSDADFPLWRLSVPAAEGFQYKFVLLDSEGGIVEWEQGDNRRAKACGEGTAAVETGLRFAPSSIRWRGAGVAIPVFSLRSERSFGTGEFYDLRTLVDWCVATRQRIIQILPVNDTTMEHTWRDSYPYNANSTFALHPQFLHLPAVGKVGKEYDKLQKELNALPAIDYERVNEAKHKFLHKIFASAEGRRCMASDDYARFFEANRTWLLPYAVYCALRDEKGTPDFRLWGEYAEYTPAKADAYTAAHRPQVEYHCFLQYHLDRQLREVRDYAHAHGIVLKGDIPIGVSPVSADVWQSPHLFRLSSQAGAPPDAFAVKGQTWGFPTYDWEEMSRDGYAWWCARFRKMSEYFDAYRIDHILGFFRIWEIPTDAVSALLGHFNPALPLSAAEIESRGLHFDKERFTAPVSQSEDVLFVEDPRREGFYHPRITAQTTDVYRSLPQWQREAFDRIYDDFYYHRHDEFWYREAMRKLPALTAATRMLVCGEDLGMIPHCVPRVMASEQILSLEIQRMPKNPGEEFARPEHYPYLAVCTTSTHDMNPIRAWWREDKAASQRYYNRIMGWWGEAPDDCTPEICRRIVASHLESPAMLTILPLQDWLGMDGALRAADPESERINVPAESRHYWRYRMHLTLEQLLAATSFNDTVERMVSASGR